LILPGDATHMGDGWETRRRRGPGHDWVEVQLGRAGTVTRAVIDTRHFKGNAPGSCSLEVQCDGAWVEVLPQTPLRPDTVHTFDKLAAAPRASRARLHIFPDGGVARLRLFGRIDE
jgi:allantoicase